jgi:hypothetical protein
MNVLPTLPTLIKRRRISSYGGFPQMPTLLAYLVDILHASVTLLSVIFVSKVDSGRDKKRPVEDSG